MKEREKEREAGLPWYQLAPEVVAQKLHTDLKAGLTEEEAKERIGKYGANSLSQGHEDTIFDLIREQLKSPLVVVLLVSGIATFILNEISSTIVIAITVAVNVIIGVVQEGRAGQAFRKLAESQTKYTTVIREGVKRVTKAENLVPGDLVEIESGNYVPADMRLVMTRGLMVNEAALTGEWRSEEKSTQALENETTVSDRTSMAFMGTAVSYGEAYGVVIATGNRTQIGQIAKHLGFENDETPLQNSISKLAKFLVMMVIALVLALILLGLFRGQSLHELFLVAIAVAVSSIPEGLPVAITVILVVGMQNILKRGGFVRSMLAAETLGSTTTILTDKTGTLTKGEMNVESVIVSSDSELDRDHVVRMGVLASDAFVENKDGETVVRGRPVERALVAAGVEADLYQDKLLNNEPRIDFLKFDSGRRYAASLHSGIKDEPNTIYVSGAPEVLLSLSGKVLQKGQENELSSDIRHNLQARQQAEGEGGARLIAIAYLSTDLEKLPEEDTELMKLLKGKLTFGGLVALNDTVRDDVKASILTAKKAGSNVIMMTGDHLGTALAIAREVGIARPTEPGFTGEEVSKMSDKELELALARSHVFARMLPEQKLRIANLLKKKGEIVAMTGDGVNDAPALRNANIGVALGSGTEVAKEASDLVLVDNSFSIIVYAIEEGRRLLDNIKKSVAFLLSTNFSEMVLIGGAMLIGLELPLLPEQILWENVIEGGLLNIVFAFEPAESDVMERDPADSKMRKILTGRLRKFTLMSSVLISLSTLLLFWYLTGPFGMSLEQARSVTFIMVSIDFIFLIFSFKNFHKPIWKIKLFSNRWIFAALGLTLAGLAAAVFIPGLAALLSISLPVGFPFWILILIGAIDLILVEGFKYFLFIRRATR